MGKRFPVCALVGISVLSILGLSAPIAGSIPRSAAIANGRYCAILVEKSAPGQVSPILKEACSDTSLDEAESAIQSFRRPGGSSSVRGDKIVIMHWYENINFNEVSQDSSVGAETKIYAYEGGCDSAGYRVEPKDYWKRNLSSLKGINGCNTARLTDIAKKNSEDFSVRENTARSIGALF